MKLVPISKIPLNANEIASHTIYKIKVNDDQEYELNARIAPHGNEDFLKLELSTDCSVCTPTGIRIVLSISAILKWKVSKADAKSVFLQTGDAERERGLRETTLRIE